MSHNYLKPLFSHDKPVNSLKNKVQYTYRTITISMSLMIQFKEYEYRSVPVLNNVKRNKQSSIYQILYVIATECVSY
jgi:hypothetical protein